MYLLVHLLCLLIVYTFIIKVNVNNITTVLYNIYKYII